MEIITWCMITFGMLFHLLAFLLAHPCRLAYIDVGQRMGILVCTREPVDPSRPVWIRAGMLMAPNLPLSLPSKAVMFFTDQPSTALPTTSEQYAAPRLTFYDWGDSDVDVNVNALMVSTGGWSPAQHNIPHGMHAERSCCQWCQAPGTTRPRWPGCVCSLLVWDIGSIQCMATWGLILLHQSWLGQTWQNHHVNMQCTIGSSINQVCTALCLTG